MLGPLGEPLLTLETPDGRELAFALWGDPDGFPILILHGTPGCRLERWPNEDLYRRLGVLMVTHDRAGDGRAARPPGRRGGGQGGRGVRPAGRPRLGQLGGPGGSGGGPHALACAALLPERVVRANCVVGVAPLGSPGLDQDAWLDGMDPQNVKEFGWALAGVNVLIPELEAEHARVAARIAEDPAAVLDGFELSESDRAELAREERVQIIRESWPENSVHGVGGWAD